MTDRIETDVLIAAPVERVWDLITTPEHVARWFTGDPTRAEIDLRAGGAWAITWSAHGTVHGRVEAVEPPRRFAYRWHSQAGVRDEPTPANSTLTEFLLTPEAGGTRVVVVESGFDDLAVDVGARTKALAENTEGWRVGVARLADYAARP